MKTSKNLLQADKSVNEEIQKKTRVSKLLKSILVTLMLSCIILLSSCSIFVRAHGHRAHGVTIGQLDQNKHHNS